MRFGALVLTLGGLGAAWIAPASAHGPPGSSAQEPNALDRPLPAPERPNPTGRSVTEPGETKPRGDPLGPRMGSSPKLWAEHREIDQYPLRSLCRGAPGCELAGRSGSVQAPFKRPLASWLLEHGALAPNTGTTGKRQEQEYAS